DDLDDYLRIRMPKLDLKSDLAKLMARHFQHRARATRTIMARWGLRASVVTPRPELEIRPPPAHLPAVPLAQPSPAAAITEALRSRDLDLSRPQTLANFFKFAIAAMVMVLLALLAYAGFFYLLGRDGPLN